jgi:hypothetical protein
MKMPSGNFKMITACAQREKHAPLLPRAVARRLDKADPLFIVVIEETMLSEKKR